METELEEYSGGDVEELMKRNKDVSLTAHGRGIIGLFKKPDYVAFDSDDNEVWLFWFEDMMAHQLKDSVFHKMFVWEDELCFVEGDKLPIRLKHLNQIICDEKVAEKIVKKYLDHTSEKVLLDKKDNKDV